MKIVRIPHPPAPSPTVRGRGGVRVGGGYRGSCAADSSGLLHAGEGDQSLVAHDLWQNHEVNAPRPQRRARGWGVRDQSLVAHDLWQNHESKPLAHSGGRGVGG